MDEQAIRIRLEGALERVEDATFDLERASRCLAGDWRHEAGRNLKLLERVRAANGETDAEVERIAAVAKRDAWPRGSAPARVLERYHQAHQLLTDRLERALGKLDGYRFDALLDGLIREALPPAGTALLSARVKRPDESWLVPAMVVLGVALPCISAISTHGGGICVGVGIGLGLMLTLPWLLSGGSMVLFTDRVRYQTRFGGKELRHQPNLLTAHTVFKNGAYETRLLAPGWKALPAERDPSDDLAALSSLLGRAPFEPPFSPEPDGVCLHANRWSWPPRHSLDHKGSLWLSSKGVLFILDGAESYDAATQQPGRGPNARARALGVALSVLGPERTAPIVERLIGAGRAERLDPRTLELAKIDSTSLAIGQVNARFERSERDRVVLWLGRRRT